IQNFSGKALPFLMVTARKELRVKSAIRYAAVAALFVSSAFAADERPLPGAPAVVAKTSVAENREQPPVFAATTSSLSIPAITPPLPAAPSAIILVKRKPETHKFFDVKNVLALSAVGASLTADALSTQKGLSYRGFYEMNPVARPFVQTRAG